MDSFGQKRGQRRSVSHTTQHLKQATGVSALDAGGRVCWEGVCVYALYAVLGEHEKLSVESVLSALAVNLHGLKQEPANLYVVFSLPVCGLVKWSRTEAIVLSTLTWE